MRPIDIAARELLFLAAIEGISTLSRGGKGCVFRALEAVRPDIAKLWGEGEDPHELLHRFYPEEWEAPGESTIARVRIAAMVAKARQVLRLVAVDRAAKTGAQNLGECHEPLPAVAQPPTPDLTEALDRLARGLHGHLDRVKDTLREEVEALGQRVEQLERKSGAVDLPVTAFPAGEVSRAS